MPGWRLEHGTQMLDDAFGTDSVHGGSLGKAH